MSLRLSAMDSATLLQRPKLINYQAAHTAALNLGFTDALQMLLYDIPNIFYWGGKIWENTGQSEK